MGWRSNQPPASLWDRWLIPFGSMVVAFGLALGLAYLVPALGWLVAVAYAVTAYVMYRQQRKRVVPRASTWTGWQWGLATLVLWYTQCGIMRHH